MIWTQLSSDAYARIPDRGLDGVVQVFRVTRREHPSFGQWCWSWDWLGCPQCSGRYFDTANAAMRSADSEIAQVEVSGV